MFSESNAANPTWFRVHVGILPQFEYLKSEKNFMQIFHDVVKNGLSSFELLNEDEQYI